MIQTFENRYFPGYNFCLLLQTSYCHNKVSTLSFLLKRGIMKDSRFSCTATWVGQENCLQWLQSSQQQLSLVTR